MNINYENFLRELGNHWAGRSGALTSSLETVAWQSNIPGVVVTDWQAFSAYLRNRADEVNAEYNAKLEKITLKF